MGGSVFRDRERERGGECTDRERERVRDGKCVQREERSVFWNIVVCREIDIVCKGSGRECVCVCVCLERGRARETETEKERDGKCVQWEGRSVFWNRESVWR